MTKKLTLPLYLFASATSLFGNSAISVVLPWLVLTHTGDPAVTGLVAATSAAPSAIAALLGGHLIDKIGRRRICVISDAGSAVAVAALAVVDALFGLNVTWFIVLGILGALFDVPGMTARETLMANVAETSGTTLDKVAAYKSGLFGLSFLAGPAIAGGLLAILPAIQVVWITAGCSALAGLAIAIMPLVAAPHEPSDSDHNSVLAGWRIVRDHRPLRQLVVISIAAMILVSPLLAVLLPSYFRGIDSPGLLGLSLSAYAVGTIVGAGIFGWLFAGRRWSAWVASNLIYAASFAAIATLAGFWPIAAGMALAGVASGLQQPVSAVVLTESVPDATRGRVFGLFSALSMLASPVGLGLMAAVLAGASLGVAAIAMAVLWVVVAVYAICAPGLRDYVANMGKEVGDADDRPTGPLRKDDAASG